MKICHIINSLSGGGAETHLLDLVHAQKDQGHSVTVIATGPDKKNMKSLEEEFTNVSDNVLRLYFPRLFNLYSYIKFFKNLKENKYDIVHTHQPRSDFMFFILKPFTDIKTTWIVSIHGKYDTYLEGNIFFDQIRKLSMPLLVKIWSSSNQIICISQEVKKWLTTYKIKSNISVVNYWISNPKLANLEETKEYINIGFMGRVNKNKGIEDLLDVFEDLSEDRYNLFIAGSSREAYLQKLNDRYELKNVNFLGYISNKEEFFSNIDIFVFPSYSEGLGLALLESMSYSKICISRNVAPMNSILNQDSGYLFHNNEELKSIILDCGHLFKEDILSLNKKLSNQYNLLNEKYNKQVLFQKIESIYQDG
jgi:glycosyltransferase involved in cell wall biosynthesis